MTALGSIGSCDAPRMNGCFRQDRLFLMLDEQRILQAAPDNGHKCSNDRFGRKTMVLAERLCR